MSILNAWSGTLILPLIVATALMSTTAAQQARPKAPGNQTAAKAAHGSPDPKKAEILNSDRWRKAMAGYYEWVSALPFYDAKQVEQIKANQAAQIAKMSAAEVQWLLDDTESKLQILATQQAQDSLAWVAEDLAAYAPKEREKRLKKMPDFATLNAAQLSLEIMKIQEKRASMAQTQALYQREQSQPHANPWDSGASAAQQSYIADHAPSAGAYSSPYRSPGVGVKPFANVPTGGPEIGYYVGARGGFGMTFSPGRL